MLLWCSGRLLGRSPLLAALWEGVARNLHEQALPSKHRLPLDHPGNGGAALEVQYPGATGPSRLFCHSQLPVLWRRSDMIGHNTHIHLTFTVFQSRPADVVYKVLNKPWCLQGSKASQCHRTNTRTFRTTPDTIIIWIYAVLGQKWPACWIAHGDAMLLMKYSPSTAAELWMSDPVLRSLAHLGSSEVGEGHQEHHRGPGPVVLLQHTDRLQEHTHHILLHPETPI